MILYSSYITYVLNSATETPNSRGEFSTSFVVGGACSYHVGLPLSTWPAFQLSPSAPRCPRPSSGPGVRSTLGTYRLPVQEN